jgi:hypothetical protein
MLSGLQAKFCTRLFGTTSQHGRSRSADRGGSSLLQIPGEASVAFFQRFAANRYVEFVHPALSGPTGACVTAAGTPASCKSVVAVPAQAGKGQWLRFSLFLDLAGALVIPLFPEPGSSEEVCALVAQVSRFVMTFDYLGGNCADTSKQV